MAGFGDPRIRLESLLTPPKTLTRSSTVAADSHARQESGTSYWTST
jgi:hypothetical protein